MCLVCRACVLLYIFDTPICTPMPAPLTGYQGVVQECTETQARIQLDSIPKTITVERAKLVVRNKDGSRTAAGGMDMGGRLRPPAPVGAVGGMVCVCVGQITGFKSGDLFILKYC